MLRKVKSLEELLKIGELKNGRIHFPNNELLMTSQMKENCGLEIEMEEKYGVLLNDNWTYTETMLEDQFTHVKVKDEWDDDFDFGWTRIEGNLCTKDGVTQSFDNVEGYNEE